MKYKGVIFDFNGVLLWDTHIHEAVYSKFAEKLRGYPLTQKEMDEHMHGVPNKNVLEYILKKDLTNEESEQLTQEKEAIYRDICKEMPDDEYKLSPGAIELLEYLKEKNIPRTIATSSEKTNVDFFIERFNLTKWFNKEKIVYDNNTFPGKPAPDIYIKAAHVLNLSPEECVVIEDAKSGIEAANTAKIGYIIALGESTKHSNLKKLEGVKETISTLSEVKKEELF